MYEQNQTRLGVYLSEQAKHIKVRSRKKGQSTETKVLPEKSGEKHPRKRSQW